MSFLFLDPLLVILNPSYSSLKFDQYLLAEIPTNIEQTSNRCNSGSGWAIEDQKKENHQNLTAKMMITSNQVQLWLYSLTRAFFLPQKLLKIIYWGQKECAQRDSKIFSKVKWKGFHGAEDTNIQNQLQN